MVGIAVVGISMAIAVSVVGKTIAVSTIVSISSGGSISRPLAVVSVVGIRVGITVGISISVVGITVVGEAMSVSIAVVGEAIAVGAVVSVGVSLSGGGCSGSREQAEGSNGSGLHVYLFV